jgi:glycosyltransferase involved in cell wall biosynthesis
MSLDLTVCIPLNDPENRNELFLREALNSLVSQTSLPAQVVMTSNSDIEYVHQIIAEYKMYFELIYKVTQTNGASMNFNNCIELATKKYVQLLCQDDFIKSPNHLKKVNASLVKSKKRWVVSGCRHFEDRLSEFSRRIYPRYSSGLARGVNTVGAPSVVMFYRDAFIPFDTRLHYMYDCDWYVRMCHNWGEPHIKRKDTIAIRIHDNQSTNQVSGLLEAEIEITASNHSSSDVGSCICKPRESN